MLREQPQQLDAGVAGAADNADLYRLLRHLDAFIMRAAD